jgi:hypothetical protein
MIAHQTNPDIGSRVRFAARALGLAALLALAAASAQAGSDQRKGTGGALELLIPVGPRASALGPGVTSDISGAEATFWNPAGLAGLEGTEALFSHTEYFADMKLNYAAIAARAGNLGVLGFSAKVLSVGEVVVTTEQAPDGTGETFNPTFSVLGVSWARAFTDRVNFGLTVDLVNEHVQNMSAGGVALDFGVQYSTGWRGLKLGMAMKNFGTSMSFSGDNLDVSVLPPGSEPGSTNRILQFSTSAFEMPSYFSLAGAYDLYRNGGNSLQLLGAFQNNNFSGDNFNGGAEFKLRDLLALRGSWFGTLSSEIDPVTGAESSSFGTGDDLYRGYAFGAGVTMRSGAAKIGVDVAYRPVREPFNDIYEAGVRLKF